MNLLFTVIGGKFKFQVQDSDLEYFLGRFEKHIALSEKKPPLMHKETFPTVMSQCAQPDVPVGSCNSEFIRIS